MNRKTLLVTSLGILLCACQPCNSPQDQETEQEAAEQSSCAIIQGLGETPGADDYRSSTSGTPRDGVFTVQEIINFWYRAAGSDNWDEVARFAGGHDFDLDGFIREWDNNRTAIVNIDAICSGNITNSSELSSELDNHIRALAYVIRWSQDAANCAESYIPDGSPDELRFSMGNSLARINFGGELSAEEIDNLQRMVTRSELAAAWRADDYDEVYGRLRREIPSFTEEGSCASEDTLLSIGQNQFRALYTSFMLALASERQTILFPVVDPRPTPLDSDEGENPISYNFAQQRPARGGRRVHEAADVYTRNLGRVQAMGDGTVIATSNQWTQTGNFRTCNRRPTGFVVIEHPSIGVVVNYGEINPSDVAGWDVGETVDAGQIIGHATLCGMAHIEFYRENPGDYIQWYVSEEAQEGQILIGNTSLETIPGHLIDGTPLLWYLTK